MQLKPDQILYAQVFGKAIRVTAVFTDDATANGYMEEHPGEGLLEVMQDLRLIAKMDDKGVAIKPYTADPDMLAALKTCADMLRFGGYTLDERLAAISAADKITSLTQGASA